MRWTGRRSGMHADYPVPSEWPPQPYLYPDRSETDTLPAQRSKPRAVTFEDAEAEQSAGMGD
jgi:hypothetical protein